MSENVIISIIGLAGTLLGAIISAYATMRATKHKSEGVGTTQASGGSSCKLIGLGAIAALVGGLVVGAICLLGGTIFAAFIIADQATTLQPGTTSTFPTISTPVTFTEAPALPSNTCPDRPGMFWMQYTDIWYGPFLNGDALMASSAGGFVVWDADMPNISGFYGAMVPYPDPFRQLPRNIWNPLLQSNFSVCIDGNGGIFGSVS